MNEMSCTNVLKSARKKNNCEYKQTSEYKQKISISRSGRCREWKILIAF